MSEAISLGIQSPYLRRYDWTLHTYIAVSPITVPEKVLGSLGYEWYEGMKDPPMGGLLDTLIPG